jgi:hypothetical protein
VNLYNLHSKPETLYGYGKPALIEWVCDYDDPMEYEPGLQDDYVKGATYHICVVNGVRHRDGDKPAFVDKDRCSEWWSNGERHRDGGPAVIRPEIDAWYSHGHLHREDGPAVTHYRVNGRGKRGKVDYHEYWHHGREVGE